MRPTPRNWKKVAKSMGAVVTRNAPDCFGRRWKFRICLPTPGGSGVGWTYHDSDGAAARWLQNVLELRSFESALPPFPEIMAI